MNAIKSLSLGILVGIIVCLCMISARADQKIAEMDAKLSAVTEVHTVSFKEQVKADEDRLYEEWVVNQAPAEVVEIIETQSAPYDNIPLAAELQIYAEERCACYGVDYFTFMALMESESTYRIDALGDKGKSIGLMQIRSDIWGDAMSEKGLDLADPICNIEAGLIIFSQHLDKYQDESTAVMMYKCGESKGREFLSAGVVLQQAKNVVERGNEIRKEATHSEE